jgi:hypothetical protein
MFIKFIIGIVFNGHNQHFFLANFCNLAIKDRVGKSNKRFFGIFEENLSYLEKKGWKSPNLNSVFLWITRTKKIPKKSTCSPT